MKRTELAASAAVAVLAAAAAWWLHPAPTIIQGRQAPASPPRTPQPAASPAPARPSGADMVMTGTLSTGDRVALSAGMPARIDSVLAVRGARVRGGQPLVLLDATQARAQQDTASAGVAAASAQAARARSGGEREVAAAKAGVSAAEAALTEVTTKLRQARLAAQAARAQDRDDAAQSADAVARATVGLRHARTEARQAEAMAAAGGVSRSDLQAARDGVRTAQSALDTARAAADHATGGPRPGVTYRSAAADADVAAAQAGVRQAARALAEQRRAVALTVASAASDADAAAASTRSAQAGERAAAGAAAQLVLRAPGPAIVASVDAHAGETAQPGQPLVVLQQAGTWHVDALAPARYLPRLHLGAVADVTIDSAPDRTFHARVEEIAPTAEPDGRTFRVRFRLQGNPNVPAGQLATVVARTGG